MILQSLVNYYDRKSADPDGGIAPEGFEYKEIPFVLVLDSDGTLVQIEDTRIQIGKHLRAKSFLVPQSEKRTAGIKAFLLWDNAEYVLGVCTKGKPERVVEQHRAFAQKISELKLDDIGIVAVERFLSSDKANILDEHELKDEILESNPFMSFRLNGENNLVCERASVIRKIKQSEACNESGVCLISGEIGGLANLQPAIKGVRGANTTGGNIVSFNLAAFNSFGKSQGANAPIGEKASFAYTTALNYLLGKDSLQKIQVGDATTVFWSDKSSSLESTYSIFFDEPEKDNPDALTNAVSSLFQSVVSGVLAADEIETRFFVLGLSPNAARLSVRFWQVGTVFELASQIRTYFNDLKITHAPHERDYLSLWRMLISVSTLGKTENIPPNLAGDWMRTILNGSPFPDSLFQAALRRISTERAVSHPRASIIKAYLNRKLRFQSSPQSEKELLVSLDKENCNAGYRLGRLFASLEKAQEEALPGINATIRDRYYASASGTPSSVMPILMRMKNHHIGKLEKGRQIFFERLIADIIGEVYDFPKQLGLQDQGRFAIGYYHQRQDFFTESSTSNSDKGE